MTPIIRTALASDAEAAVTVVKAVYEEYGFTWDPDDYHSDLYNLKESYSLPNRAFWVAELQAHIVGCIGYEQFVKLEGEPGGCFWHLEEVRTTGADCAVLRLYVHPDSRRQGIAQALMSEVISYAIKQKRQTMEIWSDKRFVAAHRLYEKLGAKLVGDRICDDPDQSPEWGMILPLNFSD